MARNLETTLRDDESSPPSTPTALLVAGEGRMSVHPIVGGRAVIGRATDCDVSIQHSALSRCHAVVVAGPPLTVQDLGSTNGTRVAREVHRAGSPITLGIGESFHIGPFSFSVLDGTHVRESTGEVLRVEDPTLDGVPAFVRNIAPSDACILVLGETGVGKELLSRTIHELSGRRGPLQQINCAALTESLVEAELFGHEKGAFTGALNAREGLLEAAKDGTVFLDEVGELPLGSQAKLLRAVEAREVIRVGGTRPIPIDVRFVAATNRDLATDVALGRFRRDLYFRLDGVTLYLPSLRERAGQIVPLALQFATAAAAKSNRPVQALSHQVLAKLTAHDWPGNVRELKATIERAVLLAGDKELLPTHVVLTRMDRSTTAPEPQAQGAVDLTAEESAERDAIIAALDACAGNQTRAAVRLGIGRSTLATKLSIYRIPRPRPR